MGVLVVQLDHSLNSSSNLFLNNQGRLNSINKRQHIPQWPFRLVACIRTSPMGCRDMRWIDQVHSERNRMQGAKFPF